MRSTSYPDVQAATLRGLFGHEDVREAVESELGFSVDEATALLGESCHQM
jgi:hypothetical protein